MMNFKSDNVAPAHPQILQALIDANHGQQSAYGNDPFSQRLQERISEIFETEVSVFQTSTGTAANCLALSALCERRGQIYCHSHAHINSEEGGAPEFFTCGAKLISINGPDGKISVAEVESHILHAQAMSPHLQRPACISITQATESGTVYSLQELSHIHHLAQQYDVPIHMDGARFANALVALGCTPAEMTWKAGVDALCLGATKNGALCAEAVIFFQPKWAVNALCLQKQFGQLMSKMRYSSAQFLGFFQDDLWRQCAQHANAMAQKLAHVFIENNMTIAHPVEANEVFVFLDKTVAHKLQEAGVGFYQWGPAEDNLYRFVASFYTTEADIENFRTLWV